VAEVGRIKPPPAKALASKNCRRDKRLSSCSFIVLDLPLRLGLDRSES
jgi:hypothetical protein